MQTKKDMAAYFETNDIYLCFGKVFNAGNAGSTAGDLTMCLQFVNQHRTVPGGRSHEKIMTVSRFCLLPLRIHGMLQLAKFEGCGANICLFS